MSRLPGRSAFAIDPGLTLLNHGSFGALPREVLAARVRMLRASEADPVGFMARAPAALRAAADRVGRFVGARGRDLVFVDNATAGVQTVLSSLAWRRGDRIVETSLGYAGVRAAVAHVARRHGLVVEAAPVAFPCAGPEAVLDAVVPHLAGARLLVVDAVTSASGLVLPVQALVEAAHARGVAVLVDAAHAPGMIPVDCRAWGADWITGNLHKWAFAPRSCAFLYAHPSRQAGTVPLVASWDVDKGWPVAFDWPGTRDVTPWLASRVGLDWIDRHGAAAIRNRNDALSAWAVEHLSARWGVQPPAPASMRAALATLPVPGALGAQAVGPLHAALRAEGLEVYTVAIEGRAWIRVSAQLHVGEEDIVRLGDLTAAWVASHG